MPSIPSPTGFPPSLPIPDRDAMALLPAFDRLGLADISLVATAAQAERAAQALTRLAVWGLDTESKPTFRVGEVSDGPHIVQLASADHAWIFQLHDPDCCAVVAELLRHSGSVKAGFGLGDDRKRIQRKLGVDPHQMLDLNSVFRARGYRKDMGVKAAVAVLFQQRFIKSKKAATSNWAQARLSEAQLVYAANDAYAAWRVYDALERA